MADAATYDDAGNLRAVIQKIHDVPRANAVFTGRGDSRAFTGFWLACTGFEYEDFDGFLDQLDEILAKYDTLMEHKPGVLANELVIAGWSARRAAPLLLVRSTLDPEGAVYEADSLFLGGEFDNEATPDTFTVADGIAAMERARQTPWPLFPDKQDSVVAYGIGGFVMHAEVSAAAPADMAVVHAWDDEIGEPINRRAIEARKKAA
ncbi:hypothetical protein ACFSCV_01710 [Methylopila henanensis]|uniref:Uncharacterized protein n=1 Tax=Methylopila henanensis TaxID=873516 RepID=A0ABW4K6N2_9HYPH